MVTIGAYYEYWKLHKKDLLEIKDFFPDKVTPHSTERHPIYTAFNSCWSKMKDAPRNSDVIYFINGLIREPEFTKLPKRYQICIMSALAYQLKQLEEDWFEDIIADIYNAVIEIGEEHIQSSILCYQPYMNALAARINKLSPESLEAMQFVNVVEPSFKALNKTMDFFEKGKKFYFNVKSASGGSLNLSIPLSEPSQAQLYEMYNECYNILLDPPEDYNIRLGYNVIEVSVSNDIASRKPILCKKMNLWNRGAQSDGYEDFRGMFSLVQDLYKCRDFDEEVIL